MNIDLTRFQAGFLDEADEHIAAMEQLLLSAEAPASDREQLDAIFRAAHSIKGGSATFGLHELASLTHMLESVFDSVRQGQRLLSGDVIDVALRGLDVAREMVARYRAHEAVDAERDAGVIERLRALVDGEPASASDAASAAPKDTSTAGVFELEYRALHLSDENERGELYNGLLLALANVGEVLDCDLAGGFRATLRATKSEGDLRDLCDFVYADGDELSIVQRTACGENAGGAPTRAAEPVVRPAESPAESQPANARGTSKAESIRVPLVKVEALVSVVSEIVTASNILAGEIHRYDGAADAMLVATAEKMARHTRDLREIVMSIRMVPISFVFGRFPRVVRDVAATLGKRIDLRLSGEDTELDKNVIDGIVDPLTHLIRNAIDHGIESPDERMALGKPPQGTVEIRASHASGNIVIDVIDDGRGLSRDNILAKARSLGWDIPDAAPDNDVWGLIFAPGFSTASNVTEFSGRGVGMDVVRRNVAALGGQIVVESTPGKGTRFAIRLPLTLAILDGLTVLVGSQIYVIPIVNVLSCLQLDAASVKRLPSGAEIVLFRGEPIALCRVHHLLNVGDAVEDVERGIIVMVETDGKRLALLVDALDAQQQLVIKSLDTNFRKTKGFAGAAVINNGRIALILDVPWFLVNHAEGAVAA